MSTNLRWFIWDLLTYFDLTQKCKRVAVSVDYVLNSSCLGNFAITILNFKKEYSIIVVTIKIEQIEQIEHNLIKNLLISSSFSLSLKLFRYSKINITKEAVDHLAAVSNQDKNVENTTSNDALSNLIPSLVGRWPLRSLPLSHNFT